MARAQFDVRLTSMDPWILAVVLLVVGMGLAVLEVFFPSGGVLSFLTFCSIAGAVVMGFRSGPGAGTAVLCTALIALPTAVVVALKVWPNTAMGKQVLLEIPASDDVLPDSDRRHIFEDIHGKVGVAKTKMLPAGAIVIDGRIFDAVSEGTPIEPGDSVKVVDVRANRLIVRAVEAETFETSEDDPMSRPVDDPFGE